MPHSSVNLVQSGYMSSSELDHLFAKLLVNPSWRVYKTKNSVRKVDAWVMKDEMPARLRFMVRIMKLLCDLGQSKLPFGETLVPIQLFMCLYEDGNDSCPLHRHDCHQVTVSLGSPRMMVISGRPYLQEHGDAVFIDKETHSIPKERRSDTDSRAPRVSLNFFYTTSTQAGSASVTTRKRSSSSSAQDSPMKRRRI
ncbi:hypothetical protein DIPPA_16440 [Diplonema papillatum]|nr:hypothetical protein DIPPA_16440 [Diplonema papillatum]